MTEIFQFIKCKCLTIIALSLSEEVEKKVAKEMQDLLVYQADEKIIEKVKDLAATSD